MKIEESWACMHAAVASRAQRAAGGEGRAGQGRAGEELMNWCAVHAMQA